jgi:hypothetical protein
MITVENTEKHVRVTIPKKALPPKRLNAFLKWLRLEETAQKSRLAEAQANRFAEDLKAKWWSKNKGRFIPSRER